jgi:hypothetical protein
MVTSFKVGTWRTVANQEVILRIGPLAKLGCFKSTAENFLVYIVTVSLASGPILSLTSWYAGVLYGRNVYHKMWNFLYPVSPIYRVSQESRPS